ncbi:MAG TPA: SIMPL domain-containing protein [Streptosporangiaceae bacterium]|nr:SIMPL domain-containing protein [Streptosporangiaceae bacterium]
MTISTSPRYLAAATGVAAAALLIGAFTIGTHEGGSASPGTPAADAATLTASQSAGRITVTGTGTVTGVPNQLVVSMTISATSYDVTSALNSANGDVRRVTTALRERGVARSAIQTSNLNISPNYNNNGVISSYGVTESLTATLNHLKAAGAQIGAAVRAGGNAVSIDNVALNLTSTGPLMAAARAHAVANAHAQAGQFARALGEPLGSVISVTPVQQSSPTPVPFADSTAAGSAKGAVPVSPGTQQLSVSVTVVYAT